jgi:hypothetical protein
MSNCESRESPVGVTGCRDDYIDLMAGVPQIAADLLQRASRQPWARTGNDSTFADALARLTKNGLN